MENKLLTYEQYKSNYASRPSWKEIGLIAASGLAVFVGVRFGMPKAMALLGRGPKTSTYSLRFRTSEGGPISRRRVFGNAKDLNNFTARNQNIIPHEVIRNADGRTVRFNHINGQPYISNSGGNQRFPNIPTIDKDLP